MSEYILNVNYQPLTASAYIPEIEDRMLLTRK